MGSEQSEFE
jgi:hypothetical protein